MTREEKIKKIAHKCWGTSRCGNCKLYGYYSVCPVGLYLKDGTPMTDWSINRAYEILFENEEIKEEQEKKIMTVEELVQVLDKSNGFYVRECHSGKTIFEPNRKDKEIWEEVKKRSVVQVTACAGEFMIFVKMAPPTEK